MLNASADPWRADYRASGPGGPDHRADAARVVSGGAQRYPDPGLARREPQAVVVLDDARTRRMLQRRQAPAVPPAYLSYARYEKLRQRVIAGLTASVVVAGVFAAWAWMPGTVLAAVVPWARATQPALVPTSASFTVAAMSGSAQAYAGPFASLDEAEAAQRSLAARGFARGRLHVDERLREAVAAAGVTAPPAVSSPAVAVIGTPERPSLVVELPARPGLVQLTRQSDSLVHVDIGPGPDRIDAQHWVMPPGVELVREVAVGELPSAGERRVIRARIAVSESARATTRVVGSRVYVDFVEGGRGEGEGGRAVSVRRQEGSSRIETARTATAVLAVHRASAPTAAPAQPVMLLTESLAQLQKIVPFLESAARTPAPDVLGAVDRTLVPIAASLAAATGAAGSPEHDLLTAAVARARQAVALETTADRVALASQAAAMIQAAAAELRRR